MAPKAAKEAAKRKKAAKQKKILIGLGLVLIIALVYAVMTLSNLNSSSPAPAVPAGATTSAGSNAADISAPAVTPGIVAAPVGSLRAFTALGRKDPFHDGGPDLTSTTSTTSTTSAPSSSKGSSGTGSKSKQPSGRLTSAVISVSGKKFAVALGAKFAHATAGVGAPLFRLVKVSAKSAVIAVLATKQTFTLHVRQPLTLAQPGAWKYTLILEPVGTRATLKVKRTTARR